MKPLMWILSLLAISQLGIASAQRRYVRPWGYGPGWGYGYRHASTAEEGIRRGMADMIRSAGAANLMNSEAAINYEDARRKYMDNRVYGTEKYFEMRQINREARAAEKGPRPSMEDMIRYSQIRKPDRLSASDLDPLTGEIAWPSTLLVDEYDPQRQRMDALYAQRANYGYLNGDEAAEVAELLDSLAQQLKDNIGSLRPTDYINAKKFIESLRYESLMTPD